MYSHLRQKLVETIKKSTATLPTNDIINVSNLNQYFFNIRSHTHSDPFDSTPSSSGSHSPATQSIHFIQSTSNFTSSYLANAISTFIGNCFKKRQLFNMELKENRDKNPPASSHTEQLPQ